MNHIENLKEYIDEDEIYQKYKKEGITDDMSDFDKFCIEHCEDIESVIEDFYKEASDKENLKFYYKSKDFDKNDGVKLSDENIQEMINSVTKGIKKQGDYYYSATGDTIVIGFRHKDEIDIYVCKNYELAKAILDEDGNWEKIDWSRDYEEEEIREKYEEFSRDELIKMLIEDRRPQYNPRKEV